MPPVPQSTSRRPPQRKSATNHRPVRLLVSAMIGFALLFVSVSSALLLECQSREQTNQTVALPKVTPGAEEARLRAQLTAQPDDLATILALADVLTNSGRYEEATELYSKAITLQPNDPRIRLAFGRMLLLAGRYADAQAELQIAAALAPHDPAPYYFLGQLAEQEPEPNIAQAKAAYATAVARDPSSPYARLAQERLKALQATPTPAP
ncbi:MAG: tetratricopeptide repeat protein [Thermorudis peleae]|nr:tetratricopeptide repeat protein [Thermorudis peleae]